MLIPALAVALTVGVSADDAGIEGRSPRGSKMRSASTVPMDERMLQAFEGGRRAAALRLSRQLLALEDAGERARISAQLVEVFALIRLHRGREALAALRKLQAEGPPMGSYLSSLTAQAMASSGDCSAAEETTSGMHEGSVFRATSWFRVGSCWLRTKELEKALRAAGRMEKEAGAVYEHANAQMLRARAYEALGERQNARDAYQKILLHYSTAAVARTAKAALLRYESRGSRTSGFTAHDLLERADRERGAQRIAVAKNLYGQVKKLSTRPKDAWLAQSADLGLVEIDMVSQAYQKAQRRLEMVIRVSRDPAIVARAYFLRGDLLSRRGQLTTALASYDTLLATLPAQPFATEAAIAATMLAYGAGRFDVASTYARWILEHPAVRTEGTVVGDDGVHRNPQHAGQAVDHALWYLAWIERRMGATRESVDGLLAQIDPSGPLAQDALYWRARLAMEGGEIHVAKVFVHWLFERAPTSFQALAAMDLICGESTKDTISECEAKMGMPSLGVQPPTADARPGFAPRDLLGPMVLFDYGLIQSARDALRAIPATELTHADRVSAAWLYRRSGDLHRGALVARRAVVGERSEVQDPVLLEVAYPKPYADIVRKESQRYGVPEDLIYAVMREESAFNPNAVSPRLARGLMQMIRPTARRLAKKAKIKGFRLRQLFQPEVSIKLGTLYLSSLLEEFDGNIVAAIASYHAGEQRVGRWLKEKGHLPSDEFIVDIPYTSTRGYVKKVLGSYGVYRMLYHPSPRYAIGLAARKRGSGVPMAQID